MTAIGPRQADHLPARHRLDRDQFDILVRGGGDPESVSQLQAAERSWRLLQLRAVLDAVSTRPAATGPLPPVEVAWQLLVEAQRQAPVEVDRLLLYPQAGTWVGYTLRRLRGSHPEPTDVPLWIDLGYLYALAAAAGIRAGLEFTLPVPVRDGFVALPTLGGAHLPGPDRWEVAAVRATAGTATVTAAGRTVPVGGDGWEAIPTIRTGAGGHILSVDLDHVDPWRNLRAPTAPDRLEADRLHRWRDRLEQAWQLLVGACPHLAAPIARGLVSISPLPAAERFRPRSASSENAFGGMLASEPDDASELAVTLVHEFQHLKLGGLLHLVPMQHGEPPHRLYAPWRDDPRPLGGVLQGAYAFAGIVEFWRCLRAVATGATAAMAQFEFARWRAHVRATLQLLATLPELTDSGRELVAGLAATATAWQAEQVPPALLAAADAAVADSRARWRLHHLRPDPHLVKELAHAWRSGTRRPATSSPTPTVETDAGARHLDTRAVLELWRLTDPPGFAHLQHDRGKLAAEVPGATAVDLLAICGENDRARAIHLADISRGPGSPAAWAALAAAGTAAAAALRERPELVRAVHCQLRSIEVAADPLELAQWLS